jgi:hypothetical protein
VKCICVFEHLSFLYGWKISKSFCLAFWNVQLIIVYLHPIIQRHTSIKLSPFPFFPTSSNHNSFLNLYEISFVRFLQCHVVLVFLCLAYLTKWSPVQSMPSQMTGTHHVLMAELYPIVSHIFSINSLLD